MKITPFLWFDKEAEAAAKFYTSIFKNSKIGTITRYGEAGPGPAGTVLTVSFTLDGNELTALNGGPIPGFEINGGISFVVPCKTQKEIDYYWRKLSKGGQIQQCGWLKDRYGVHWQIVPAGLSKLIASKDRAKSNRVMRVMLQMIKLDMKALEQAAKK